MKGLRRGWEASRMTTKLSILLNRILSRVEASLGCSVEAGCISGDVGPKETLQDLLAWTGLGVRNGAGAGGGRWRLSP